MAVFIPKAKEEEEQVLQIGGNQFELIDFRLKDYPEGKTKGTPIYEGIYGINVAKVREINRLSTLTKIPNCHSCIEGILELRDEAIPIINLAKYLGYQNHQLRPTDSIIICEFNKLVVGFVVHQAVCIRRISWEAILPPAKLIGREGGCITGMHKISRDNGSEKELILLILDLERIVAEINGEVQILDKFHEEKLNHQWTPSADESRTVLVVDDSQTARSQIELFLSQHGYRVFTANNGEEGLAMINSLYNQAKERGKNLLDLLQVVVLDVEMPRLDGYALTQLIKKDERFSNLKVVLSTSVARPNHDGSSRSLADEYIVKSDIDTLANTINKFWTQEAA